MQDLQTQPTTLLRLESLAIVDARGADAVAFLQGQLSNDLAGAEPTRAFLAGYCNPKGRLLGLPLVIPLSGGAFRLVLPAEIVDGLLQRLRMFVMRADVTFEQRTGLSCRGLWMSPGGETLKESLTDEWPASLDPSAVLATTVLDVITDASGEDTQMLRWHDAQAPAPAKRYLLVAPDSASAGEGDGDGEDSVSADRQWRLGDISAGIPRIGADNREAFVPQMVNLQHIGGLSFRKGCYPGQEIVARMHYLGKLKRHMSRFRTATPLAVEPGAALQAGDDTDVGIVVDAVPSGAGVELLAVVKIDRDGDSLSLQGTPLERLDLPYALAAEAATDCDLAGDST